MTQRSSRTHRRITGKRTARRWLHLALGLFVLLVCLGAGLGYREATQQPVVRTIRFSDPDWPAKSRSVRILLMSDLHVQGPDMSPGRLAEIILQANALRPDLVVLAGDFERKAWFGTRSYSAEEIVEPLRRIDAPLGVYAIFGNNDRSDRRELKAALKKISVTVLEDKAVQVGPIALAGLYVRPARTINRLLKLTGTRILVAHSPDIFADVPPDIPLTLAGHTHCGQILIPGLGALATGSRFGSRYLCGITNENDKALIVTAGLGTSNLPLRFGAPPDVWLITLGR